MAGFIADVKRAPRALVCAHCAKIWRDAGSKPEKKPRPIFPGQTVDGKCPVCLRILSSITA